MQEVLFLETKSATLFYLFFIKYTIKNKLCTFIREYCNILQNS